MTTTEPTALGLKLAEIDAEISRLQPLLARYEAEFDAENAKLAGAFSVDRHTAAYRRYDGVQSKINRLEDQRDELELNGLPEGKRAPASTATALSPVDINDDLSETALAKMNLTEDETSYFRSMGKHVESLSKTYGLTEREKMRPPTMRFLVAVEASIHALLDRISDRVAALEAAPKVEYRGVWRAEEEYPPGSMVTHAGSVWHTKGPVKGVKPGGGVGWTLAVKRGGDAK